MKRESCVSPSLDSSAGNTFATAVLQTAHAPVRFKMKGDKVAYSNYDGVYLATKGAAMEQQLESSSMLPRLDADDTYFYWLGAGYVRRGAWADGSVSNVASSAAGEAPKLRSGNVYWITNDLVLHRVPAGGGATENLATLTGADLTFHAWETDGTSVYWVTAADGQGRQHLYKAAVAAGSAGADIAVADGAVIDTFADGNALIFTTFTASKSSIAQIVGGNLETLVTAPPPQGYVAQPPAFGATSSAIYYAMNVNAGGEVDINAYSRANAVTKVLGRAVVENTDELVRDGARLCWRIQSEIRCANVD